MVDSGSGKIIISQPFLKFSISKKSGAHLHLDGNLLIIPHIGGEDRSLLSLSENSKLEISGEFTIGHGVRIMLAKNSSLSFGGKYKESASGITSNTLIMVYKKIVIGKDFLCAWNNFISDSDWHYIEGQSHQKDLFIGDHVWVGNSCNILKGAHIGNNCIVASNTKIVNKQIEDGKMVAGIPSKVIKSDVTWSRDIK